GRTARHPHQQRGADGATLTRRVRPARGRRARAAAERTAPRHAHVRAHQRCPPSGSCRFGCGASSAGPHRRGDRGGACGARDDGGVVVHGAAGGLVPDELHANSWTQHVHEVDPLEMLEVQLANTTAPFLLISRLRPAMAASTAHRKYVVNVSAMEGQFARRYKGPGHPHTNMAKAALNMLTRTSAGEMLETDGILMTAVDTGWLTDERPHYT